MTPQRRAVRNVLTRDTAFLTVATSSAIAWFAWFVTGFFGRELVIRGAHRYTSIGPEASGVILVIAVLASLATCAVLTHRLLVAIILSTRGVSVAGRVVRIVGRWRIEVEYHFEGKHYRRSLMLDAKSHPPLKKRDTVNLLVDPQHPVRVARDLP